METPSSPKRGIRGEETLMGILCIRTIALLLFQSLSSEEGFSIGNWGLVMIACCLMLQILAIYNFPLRKKEDHSELVLRVPEDLDTMCRPAVNNGVYCVLLVPLVILMEALYLPPLHGGSAPDMSEVIFLLATVCGLLLLAPSHLKKSSGILYLMLVFASAIMVILTLVHKGGDSVPWISGFGTTMCAAYFLPSMCPWSFTFGELSVVCHLIGSAVFRMGAWMDRFIFNDEWPVVTNENYVYVFGSVLLLSVVLASAQVLHWEWCDNIVPFVLVYFAFSLIAVGVLRFLTGNYPVLWLFWFIFGEHRRVSLLMWWSAIVVITVISFLLYTQHVSSSQSGKSVQASISARKVFHGVVVAVYVPGLVVDPYFLLLASVVALSVLAVLEIARVINVQWVGSVVENSFRVFVDDRDQGPVLLTHIYLLVGLSVPLWLSHFIRFADVRNFCGVISLGIGDTVACLVGTHYGSIKWPGTKKSFEGTAASVFVQLLFVLITFLIGWLDGIPWFSVVFAVVTSSLFEAFVSQIDNLVLPLYMLAAIPPVM